MPVNVQLVPVHAVAVTGHTRRRPRRGRHYPVLSLQRRGGNWGRVLLSRRIRSGWPPHSSRRILAPLLGATQHVIYSIAHLSMDVSAMSAYLGNVPMFRTFSDMYIPRRTYRFYRRRAGFAGVLQENL